MSQYTRLPTQSISATNPSVGINGTTAPTSSTEVAGVNPSGNLNPLHTDASNNLLVNVGVAVLPTGAATSALQVTGNSVLGSILLDQTNGTQLTGLVAGTASVGTVGLNAGTNNIGHVDGQGTAGTPAGGVVSVQGVASGTAIPISGTVTATNAANGTPGTTAPTTATQIGGTDGTNLRALLTDTTGRAIVTSPGIPAALGQQAAAASLGVTLSNEDVQDLNVTGAATQTAVVNNILTTSSGTAATDLNGYRSASVQVVSTGTGGTFIFEGSNDNVNFQTIPVYNQSLVTGVAIVAAITATASQFIYTFPTTARFVRLRIATLITGGSIQAVSKFSQTNWHPFVTQIANNTAANLLATVSGTIAAVTAITNALPAGTNNIGLVGTGGSTGVSNAPIQNVYTSTSITTAAYTQLVASTTAATNYLDIFDSSGQAMILATGAGGSEVILAYVPPGGDQIRVQIPISTRIAYKALTATASTGYLLMNFWK